MQDSKSLLLIILFLVACSPAALSQVAAGKKESITKTSFGKLPDGREAFLFTLRNSQRMEVKITNYGGIITSIKTPDYDGVVEEVVLGYDSLSGYLKASPLFGAVVGRYANRIANAKFTLDGQEYQLAANNGTNSIHGGRKGFDKVLWDVGYNHVSPAGPSLQLTYLSKDMEEGFPGNLKVEIAYTLTNFNELYIHYTATTDKPTVVNLTNHSYFNLSGNVKRDVLGHDMTIYSDEFLAVDQALIPTGRPRSVVGTPFDFRKAHKIGERIDAKDEQIEFGKGYDHCFVSRKEPGAHRIVVLVEPESGRMMQVHTSAPGMQVYSGNHLNGSITSRGSTYGKRFGICFETGHFPNAPNREDFPSSVVKPGKPFDSTTIFQFSVR